MTELVIPSSPFICRTPSKILIKAFGAGGTITLLEIEEVIRTYAFSKDGKYLAVSSNQGVTVYCLQTFQKFASLLPRKNVVEMSFSPLSTFLNLFERPTSTGNTKNICIWDFLHHETGEIVSFTHKMQDTWHIQWTADESYFVFLSAVSPTKNEVHVYAIHNLSEPSFKYSFDGIRCFALSSCGVGPPKIAVFMGERNGSPASVRIFNLPNFNVPVAMKSFYKADRVNLYWSANSKYLLVLAHTEIDKTGKSYYGENNLVFLSGDGKFDCLVRLDKDGPIHDIAWNPISSEFVVVYGFMPARTILFDARCEPLHDFGTSPRNFVRFNQQGNLICLAGFGNLAGNVELWDRSSFGKSLEIPLTSRVSLFKASGATICEWSPNGQGILLATLSPRLRVDNGYTIIDYHGNILLKEDFKELNQADWLPSTLDSKQAFTVLSSKNRSNAVTSPLGSKPMPTNTGGAYIPPNRRGLAGSAPKLPIGMEHLLSSPTIKETSSPMQQKSYNAPSLRQANSSSGRPSPNTVYSANSSFVSSTNSAAVLKSDQLSPHEKAIRNVTKKLEQIAILKQKLVSGSTLEANQLEKITRENDLLKELKNLNLK